MSELIDQTKVILSEMEDSFDTLAESMKDSDTIGPAMYILGFYYSDIKYKISVLKNCVEQIEHDIKYSNKNETKTDILTK